MDERQASGTAPRSWADDVRTYRDTRGSRSLSTVDKAGVPERFSRTNYVPFCDVRHSLYAYNDFVDGQGTVRVDPSTQSQRCARHGWGDTSLLKEDGMGGTLHPRGGAVRGGKANTAPPRLKGDRHGLFGVLQQTEAGGLDSWIGNHLIEPTMGKRACAAPVDPKGRQGLAEVLQATTLSSPSVDAWMGHALLDPAKGKAQPAPPAALRGRTNLNDVIHHTILDDPQRHDLTKRGVANPMADAWCGGTLLDPQKGKLAVPSPTPALRGATFPAVPPGWSDFPRPHKHMSPQPVQDTTQGVLNGAAAGQDDWGRRGKHAAAVPTGEGAGTMRVDMYANMTYKPLARGEQEFWSHAHDTSRPSARRHVPPAGSSGVMKGPDMLHWKPDVRVCTHVPLGKLAQEQWQPRAQPPALSTGSRGPSGR